MLRELPRFREYTVDLRRCEFRLSCVQCHRITFIPFASEEGDTLLTDIVDFYRAGGTLFYFENDDGVLKVIPIALSAIQDAVMQTYRG